MSLRRHKEAFALMWYACACGHRERIWNSRDGVTPFGFSCPSCGKNTLLHVDWQRDEAAKWHIPHRGQRVWRDGTPDEAAALMERRISYSRRAGFEVDEAEAEKLIREARDGGGDFRPGWPTLVMVAEKGEVP